MQLGLGASSHIHTAGPPSLAGPITYRHLLSAGTLNPSNPLRVIAHCDVDAAYAAFEAKRLGIDPHKIPIAVQQWNGLIAISYAARKFGITRHETVEDATKKCPELVFAHVATYAQGSDHAEYHEDPRPQTHKVSLDPYRRESQKILAIFKKTCPAGAVEKASIDESFFDLTIEVRKALLEEYPVLRRPPEDSTAGLDTPLPDPPQDAQRLWAGLGHLIPIEGDVGEGQDVNSETRKAIALKRQKKLAKGSRSMAPSMDTSASLKALQKAQDERTLDASTGGPADSEARDAGTEKMMVDDSVAPAASSPADERPPPSAQRDPNAPIEDEGGGDQAARDETAELLELEDVEITWQDIALAMGAKLMNKVRAAVREELEYTTSAGIASNKTMAKLCSGWRKPNAQTIMRPAAVKNFLKVLPFQKIRFLGGKLGDAMANEWQSATVGDLWSVTLEQMQARFGEESGWVYNVVRGIDHSEVKERVANKTMLASKNVRPFITTWAQGQHWLSILATELSIRLAEGRETEPNLWPKTIVLRFLRIGDSARSRQAAFPLARLSADLVRKAAEKLWTDAFGEMPTKLGGGSGSGGNSSPSKSGGGRDAAGASNEGMDGKEVRPGIVTIALGFSGLEKTAENGQQRIDQTFFTKGAQATSTTAASNQRQSDTEHFGDSAVAGSRSSPSSAAEQVAEAAIPSSAVTTGDGLLSPPRKKQKRTSSLETMFQTQKEKRTSDLGSSSPFETDPQSSHGAVEGSSKSVRETNSKAPQSRPIRKRASSWKCPQCGEVLRPPTPIIHTSPVLGYNEAGQDLFGDDPDDRNLKRKAPWPFDEDDGGEALQQGGRGSSSKVNPAHVADEALEAFDDIDAEAWLQAARVAHEDEHFARQLQEEENKRNRMLAGSQAFAAARAAAASSSSSSSSQASSQRPTTGKNSAKSGSGSSGKSGKAKKSGGTSGNIASFFSQKPRNT
ncbi:unnamed protein product [Tilletia controversa]|nr:unnamed protein product [Tilletia controversa]CAD6947230.1 unnamed protein product [Tilletia controversa]CAD6951681.1 unnamed protein product [Tilletia controversa]CAD6977654.1 unnamed protein product [Tilletia controversa]CAD6977791.1 unnamed protein product [Tilletia controversa]